MEDKQDTYKTRITAAAERYRTIRDELRNAREVALAECQAIYSETRKYRRPMVRHLYAARLFTLADIGDICGISRQRVLTILTEAGDIQRRENDEAEAR